MEVKFGEAYTITSALNNYKVRSKVWSQDAVKWDLKILVHAQIMIDS